MPPGERPLHVLVVDDFALVREVMRRALGEVEGLSVTTAADPLIALRKMSSARPDVVLLDLAMPRMDGLSFLRKVMAEDPIPIVVCSALTSSAAELAMRALHEGALEVVANPGSGRPEAATNHWRPSWTLLSRRRKSTSNAGRCSRSPHTALRARVRVRRRSPLT